MTFLPMTIIHDGSKCVEGHSVNIGWHVVELRHPEGLGVNVPVLVGLCGCCEPIGDDEMRRVSDAALDQLMPRHIVRQLEIAKGAPFVTEKEALAVIKIGRTKFWSLVGEGKLPPATKRGGGNVWILEEILSAYAKTLTPA